MQKFINNWSASLLQPLAADATTLAVDPAAAVRLDGLGNGDHYLLTLASIDDSGRESAWEIVRAIAVADGEISIERGLEGTSPAAWPAGTAISARLTAGSVAALAGGGATRIDIGRLVTQAPDLGYYFDAGVGYALWAPFSALAGLGTYEGQPAAVLGDSNSIACAVVRGATAVDGASGVVVQVPTDPESETYAGTPTLVSYGNPLMANPHASAAVFPADAAYSSIDMRATFGYSAPLPDDIAFSLSFSLAGHSFDLRKSDGQSAWVIGYTDELGDYVELPVLPTTMWSGSAVAFRALGSTDGTDPTRINWTIYRDTLSSDSVVSEEVATLATVDPGSSTDQLWRPNVSATLMRGVDVTSGVFTWRMQSFFIEAILA